MKLFIIGRVENVPEIIKTGGTSINFFAPFAFTWDIGILLLT